MTLGRFPRSGALFSGYSVAQVDAFFARVEAAFGAGEGEPVRASDIRCVGFDMVRNGYHTNAVDPALDRLEQRALEWEREHLRDHRPADEAQNLQVDALRSVLSRPPRQRFPRAAGLRRGYSVADVDAYCDRLLPVLDGQRGPGVRGVRSAVFRPQRGGYAEPAVDDTLDRMVEVLLRRFVRMP